MGVPREQGISYRLWFNTLIRRSQESRTPVELRHTWLHSDYTTVDAMLEIGSTSATVEARFTPAAGGDNHTSCCVLDTAVSLTLRSAAIDE